ncbi:uncharacterized protein M421DRAFT_267455 [Didymella exigua CBS 183.55]|uniref:Uncharacterized protein n=1 Tax=Didymella exigua CBS 183.55 TaxID=1150837 RepID=A0A6A5REU1_9PLEO|nr:uncharacterized protein M421DRAFT_267455 [Didymella exigua CBS 183.55]KAF1925036.1 hypothetical protein M421DRAFT_267455 [Didymella exigua CBS 183.55]
MYPNRQERRYREALVILFSSSRGRHVVAESEPRDANPVISSRGEYLGGGGGGGLRHRYTFNNLTSFRSHLKLLKRRFEQTLGYALFVEHLVSVLEVNAATVFGCLTLACSILHLAHTLRNPQHHHTMDTNSPSWFVASQQATTSLRGSAFIAALIFTTLAFIIVILRWYSKIRLVPGTLRLEDFVITAATVSTRPNEEASD